MWRLWFIFKSVKWFCSEEKASFAANIYGISTRHKTNTTVFIIISAIKRGRLYFSRAITGTVSLFGNVIYSSCSWRTLQAVPVSCRINNIPKEANFGNNCAREIEFVLCDGGDYGKHHSVGFVQISKIFSAQDIFQYIINSWRWLDIGPPQASIGPASGQRPLFPGQITIYRHEGDHYWDIFLILLVCFNRFRDQLSHSNGRGNCRRSAPLLAIC